MSESIRDRVIRVIAETLDVPLDAVHPETRIKADLGADSMQIVTLMITLDDEFDAEFNVEQIPTTEVTVAWIIDFVTATVGGSSTVQ
jgi:acyl carrier protein